MPKTNPPGKNMAYISTSLNKEILTIIDARADKIGLTRGGYLRQILVQWYENGCPPINKVDQLVLQSESEYTSKDAEDKPSLKVAEDSE